MCSLRGSPHIGSPPAMTSRGVCVCGCFFIVFHPTRRGFQSTHWKPSWNGVVLSVFFIKEKRAILGFLPPKRIFRLFFSEKFFQTPTPSRDPLEVQLDDFLAPPKKNERIFLDWRHLTTILQIHRTLKMFTMLCGSPWCTP